jgi:hypothetical protein
MRRTFYALGWWEFKQELPDFMAGLVSWGNKFMGWSLGKMATTIRVASNPGTDTSTMT